MTNSPRYLAKLQNGELKKSAELGMSLLSSCSLCPHQCQINRNNGETGICHAGKEVLISSVGPHFGEEDVLVGKRGSGTIFFSYCNLRCVFCQNYELSHYGEGRGVSTKRLAEYMLKLEQRGCHNINFVSPTHYAAQIVEAVYIAAKAGLTLPLVYNSGGYDSLNTLELLDGIIDIYMPDLKFMDETTAEKYTGVRAYPSSVKAAIKEMHRQVGDLVVDEQGLAVKGLIIRHLVMPGGLAHTQEAMAFLASEISPNTYVNIMGQYSPQFKALDDPDIGRIVTKAEVRQAYSLAREAGLHRFAR